MKFRGGREALGEAVAWVARALTSRPVVPVLSGLMLQADGDGLMLSCFDYEVSARMRIDADVVEAGAALVPGRLLAEITRSLPALDVEVASDADMVGLTCGSAEFTLVSLPAEEYPALPEQPPPAGTVDGGVLAVAAAQVGPAASRDDTLPMLTAVCLEIDGETLTLAATDRYRLPVREGPWIPAVPLSGGRGGGVAGGGTGQPGPGGLRLGDRDHRGTDRRASPGGGDRARRLRGRRAGHLLQPALSPRRPQRGGGVGRLAAAGGRAPPWRRRAPRRPRADHARAHPPPPAGPAHLG